ncbi:MAG: protein kinase [Eubacterium sp.]|nr:protein kinase [Eubacterium sp.]
MLKPGTILDERYEIIDIVGTGGMSTVYRARDNRLNRYVAVKVLKTEYANDANFVSKFRVEAQASAGLTHPNIVSVFDVSEDNGRHFIVMELVEGITLKEFINLNGRLSMDQALDFSIQIASGVEVAHEHHVIHRDIKPQNIIVAKNGNLKVTDFGIAKAATSNTMSTAGMGSVHYISPEQARGGYSDERSDIYSLGITMYEMVTGRVPFEGDTNVAIALMHIQNEIVPPRQYYPDIFTSFEKIILKATQKKPERRYLTAAALIADLKRVKANPNIDIIVAPPTVPNSPTQRISEKDIQKINDVANGTVSDATKVVAAGTNTDNGYDARGQKGSGELRTPRMTSEPRPDREKLDRLIDEADDYDDYYDYDPREQENEPAPRQQGKRPPVKAQSIKRVSDDDYDDYDDYDSRDYDRKKDEEEDVDPKLAKAVMIGGIAAAVIVAVIILIIVGNVMGWFKFGKGNDSTTAEITTDISGSTEATTASEEKVLEMIEVATYTQMWAEKALKEQGFTNIRVETAYDDKMPMDYVISANHAKGEKIPASTEIVLVVSLGAEEVEVPDVTGYTDEQASKVMQEAGFTVQHSFEYSDTVEKDKIIRTTPEKNSKAGKGSKIILVTSNGAEVKTTNVPKVTGISESAAKSSLEAVKLTVGKISHEYSETEAGIVIRQSVGEGVVVNEGTEVDLVISDGPKVVTYTGSVSGSITASDEEFLANGKNVVVTAYINDGSGSHEVVSVEVATVDKASISLSGSVTGLAAADGNISISVIDSDGVDVTAYYRNSLTLTFTQE